MRDRRFLSPYNSVIGNIARQSFIRNVQSGTCTIAGGWWNTSK